MKGCRTPFNGQQFPVSDVIILLRWSKVLGVERARLEEYSQQGVVDEWDRFR